MPNAIPFVPVPDNEPVLGFAPGSPERATLSAEVRRQSSVEIEIPLIIGGREVRTGNTVDAVMPHDHGHVLARVHTAGEKEVAAAIDAALAARRDWAAMPWESRSAVFLKAAALLAGTWRMRINAATMLNQSKTCHQAEIDAACELIDFFRFNCRSLPEIYASVQPPISPPGLWNQVECRALEGFVYAVTPFNFTSIAANLCHAPALMGNTVVWKPSPSALLSNYELMRLFEAAGLPPGVINFIPGDAEMVTRQCLGHRDFGGLHYTGSTSVFRSLWKQIAENLPDLRSYPRIVGETGGKDFIVAHRSADPDSLVTAIVRGSYEFQGQKCSAASRAYIPKSVWSRIEAPLREEIGAVTMGDPTEYTNFMGAVIHETSFERCASYIAKAKSASDATILAGGGTDRTKGWFVEPTLIRADRPDYPSMCEEIFGPIMTLFVYDDGDYERILRTCDETSPYALTGAIFAQERTAVETALEALRDSAGNFYINDKPTGAVVGQQPFGGSRASGTNDKAGSYLNLLRWMNPRTIKETFEPPTDWRYPFLGS